MLTTGVVFLIHKPPVIEYLWSLGTASFQPCVPAFLAGTMELDQIPVEIPGQIRWAAAALALLTVPRSLFPHCFYYEESKKQRHQRVCSVPAVCFIHCIKTYMLSALLSCRSERQTIYPAGAIMIRIKMLISSFTSDGAKPCSIVMRLFAKCTRMGNNRFLFFS